MDQLITTEDKWNPRKDQGPILPNLEGEPRTVETVEWLTRILIRRRLAYPPLAGDLYVSERMRYLHE